VLVSLDSYLVGFFVSQHSTTWPQLTKATVLGLSALAATHRQFCRKLGKKEADRLDERFWVRGDSSPAGRRLHCLHGMSDRERHRRRRPHLRPGPVLGLNAVPTNDPSSSKTTNSPVSSDKPSQHPRRLPDDRTHHPKRPHRVPGHSQSSGRIRLDGHRCHAQQGDACKTCCMRTVSLPRPRISLRTPP